jgi:hypothetical protein
LAQRIGAALRDETQHFHLNRRERIIHRMIGNFRYKSVTSRGRPPKNSKARICEPIQHGKS